jgi:hypothetical protein
VEINEDGMAAASSKCGRDKKPMQVLIGKPEGKVLLGIPGVNTELILKWALNIASDSRSSFF